MIAELVAGAVSALLFVVLARRYGPRAEGRLYAVGLVFAAVIYVGFAVFGGAERRWVVVEFAGLLPFTGLAWLGLRSSAWWLAVGWLAHAAWDTGLHLALGTPAFVPAWYPAVCLGFDLLVAGAIGLRARVLGDVPAEAV
jgi:hypothetical protein